METLTILKIAINRTKKQFENSTWTSDVQMYTFRNWQKYWFIIEINKQFTEVKHERKFIKPKKMVKTLILINIKSKDVHKELIRQIKNKAWRIQFIIEELQDSVSVKKKYPQGFPAGTVLLLSEKLRSGCSEEIFSLFTKENKADTLIVYSSEYFKKAAKKAGFAHLKNIVTSDNELTAADLLAHMLKGDLAEVLHLKLLHLVNSNPFWD